MNLALKGSGYEEVSSERQRVWQFRNGGTWSVRVDTSGSGLPLSVG